MPSSLPFQSVLSLFISPFSSCLRSLIRRHAVHQSYLLGLWGRFVSTMGSQLSRRLSFSMQVRVASDPLPALAHLKT